MTAHAISVVVLGDGRYRALCSCQYKGTRSPSRAVAEAQAEQHLSYVAEVRTMTGKTQP